MSVQELRAVTWSVQELRQVLAEGFNVRHFKFLL